MKEVNKEVARLASKRKARRAEKLRRVKASTFGKTKNKLATARQLFGFIRPDASKGARFNTVSSRIKKVNKEKFSLKTKHKRMLKRKCAK